MDLSRETVLPSSGSKRCVRYLKGIVQRNPYWSSIKFKELQSDRVSLWEAFGEKSRKLWITNNKELCA